jgi:hypothetical protein
VKASLLQIRLQFCMYPNVWLDEEESSDSLAIEVSYVLAGPRSIHRLVS